MLLNDLRAFNFIFIHNRKRVSFSLQIPPVFVLYETRKYKCLTSYFGLVLQETLLSVKSWKLSSLKISFGPVILNLTALGITLKVIVSPSKIEILLTNGFNKIEKRWSGFKAIFLRD